MTPGGPTFRSIVADSILLLRRHARLAACSFLFAAAGPALEFVTPPEVGLFLSAVFGLVLLYIQLLIVATALRGLDLLPQGADPRRPTLGRYPSAFFQSVIYGLGVIVGLALLLVPGLIVFMRWLPALPAMVAEDRRAGSALRRSWQLTAGEWRLLLPIAGALVLLEAAGFGLLLFYPEYGPPPWPLALAVGVVEATAAVAGSVLSVALYAALAGPHRSSGTTAVAD